MFLTVFFNAAFLSTRCLSKTKKSLPNPNFWTVICKILLDRMSECRSNETFFRLDVSCCWRRKKGYFNL